MTGKANILIVDDNASQCKTMSLILRHKGYAVATASDGPEAIERVREGPFDMIFMDIKMPLMDGVDTYRRIKDIRPDADVYAFRIVDSEGKTRWLELNAVVVEWQGKPATLNFLNDITERLALDAELRQAQKMEAVGRLAGGVAHDFNNMLTVILGYVDLALAQIDPADLLYHDIERIGSAARRSGDLTRQLLAFSRKQTAVPRVIDLNEAVARQKKMLERLIGEDIRIDLVPADDVWNIRIDPSQIDQIMTNLAVNARDAIAGVGTVTIETSNVTVLTAGTTKEACALAEQYAGGIDLLLTDVVMPTMNGKELAARIREMNPAVKTLFMSGYTSDVIAKRGVVDQNVEFIQKPFAMDALAHKVREVLDG